MSKYKHRCLLPFHHIAVRPDNRVFPCCQFDWHHTPEDLNLAHDDVFNHPFMQQLRESMIKDEYVAGCSSCYEQEKLTNGKSSMRLNFINDGLGTKIPENPVLTHIDLALSNVCNNKCRMCGPALSTNWYSDAIKLNTNFFDFKIDKSGVKYSKELFEIYDFSKLRHIKLIGGEPLMEEKKFIEILNKCNLSRLKIFLTTNATMIPSETLKELFDRCEFLSVNLSIDAYGSLNSFLRKGSKWEKVEKVIDWFLENYPRNGKNYVNIFSVISIYNVNIFYKLEEYIKNRYSNKIGIEWRMVQGKDWLYCSNLPLEVKHRILSNLIGKVDYYTYKMVENEMMKTSGNFSEFLDMDNQLNNIRSEHWKDHNPELYDMLKEYIKES
jgi:sulfatase maturation enzyme AslB (radical SAM superfamily)